MKDGGFSHLEVRCCVDWAGKMAAPQELWFISFPSLSQAFEPYSWFLWDGQDAHPFLKAWS
jgi:hypothetical protein